MLAITAVVASVVVSCKAKLAEAQKLDLSKTPLQKVEDMFAVQTRNGLVVMRIEADIMERYETDSTSLDTFPEGLAVYSYTDEGLLESVIISNEARHITVKGGDQDEVWQAFGDVVIHNVINRETMETDTIYWDRGKQEIYTDCYVKMYSPDGFMQGFGMHSDDHARNAILHNPFNGYALIQQDTTKVVIDSVNFIGPFAKK